MGVAQAQKQQKQLSRKQAMDLMTSERKQRKKQTAIEYKQEDEIQKATVDQAEEVEDQLEKQEKERKEMEERHKEQREHLAMKNHNDLYELHDKITTRRQRVAMTKLLEQVELELEKEKEKAAAAAGSVATNT